MTSTAHGASAGMRDKANVEIMHQRRYRKNNEKAEKKLASTNATDLEAAEDLREPSGLNELDKKGTGIQVESTYYMQVSNVGGEYK
jgi:hypothetical protein